MDGLTLAIDASTLAGTVAVMRGNAVVAERTVAMRGEDEERLMPAVASALAEANATPRDLNRVVCGAGPGSFTSLRIAAAIAKGIAAPFDTPFFAVSSLALSAIDAGPARWLVTLDALRGEWYAAAYEWDGAHLTELLGPCVVTLDVAAKLAVDFAAEPIEARPHARAAAPALDSIVAMGTVDRATWEPLYGRLAEAQVKWEAAHGRPLGA